MKVKVEFTLDVDPEAWATEYGVHGERLIRADVKAHAENTVTEHFRTLDLLQEATQ